MATPQGCEAVRTQLVCASEHTLPPGCAHATSRQQSCRTRAFCGEVARGAAPAACQGCGRTATR
eukprot:362120-Chlamydomonas_euryale.AAC.4